MQRNLIYVRAGDNSLHRSWIAPRENRNYDLFISYFGKNPGTFQKDGEYYEVASGLKFPTFARLLEENPDLIYSYEAVWIPDDDLLTSAASINRMFELFHRHKLQLAQPALARGSHWAHPVTTLITGNSLHYSRYVEVMCPVFHRKTLKKIAHTFTLNSSSWGIDFLWSHLLSYPSKRIAILDETPVVHTRPVGKGSFYDVLKGKEIDAEAENRQIVNQYGIDWETLRSKNFGSIRAKGRTDTGAVRNWTSLYYIQERLDHNCKGPIFYENRSRRLGLKQSERPDLAALSDSGTSAVKAATARRRLLRLVASGKRLTALARDIANHWRGRKKHRDGKAMIVCANRQIALRLYRTLLQIRPALKQRGLLEVITTEDGSSRTKLAAVGARRRIAERFKDPGDPLEVVIVDDVHCEDFDCPHLNTVYMDSLISVGEHIRLIRRLMGIFKDRLGVLAVDYLGLSDAVFRRGESPSDKTEEYGSRRSSRSGTVKLLDPPARTVAVPGSPGVNVTRRVPRIAHLFLVRANLNHEQIWQNFFRGYENYHNIYVHAKDRDQVTSEPLRGRQVGQWCETAYGKVSLVRAELYLLEEALRDKTNEFFLLHSESCVPLRPFDHVYEELFRSGRSWLYSFQGDMYRYYALDVSAIRPEWFYKSSQFFCLTRSHAQLVLAKGKLEHWAYADCPDEHYVPTVLAMSGRLGECLRRPLTFADWNVKRRETPYGPTTFHKLSSSDVRMLERTDCLFARKFASDSDIARHIAKLQARGSIHRTNGVSGASDRRMRPEERQRTAGLLAA